LIAHANEEFRTRCAGFVLRAIESVPSAWRSPV
jgi:hypothetical protein